MRTRSFIVPGLALAGLLALASCAGPARTRGSAPAPATAATHAPGASHDSALVVLELRMRRSGELADTRGALRVFDQDLSVEFRLDGRGPGLDAGDVTLEGRPLRRDVNSKGAVTYRLGRDEPEGGTRAGDNPWATLAATGGTRVPAVTTRVKLAPFPLVTQPTPGQSGLRSDELTVVMLPPVPDVWYRVSMVGEGDTVTATDLGAGRWLFPLGSLGKLGAGRAHVLIEVETSCGVCPAAGLMRANWSTRTELEVPLTLL